jgi:3-oxoadipate CoA-transferase beta subunit
MDLAVGAKQVFVMMEHLTRDGQSKLVHQCTYPLTGAKVVTRVYTDLATLEITKTGFKVIDRVAGLSHEELEEVSQLSLEE